MNIFYDISVYLTIIVGISMYVFGSIGNVLNIIVFARWTRSKKFQSKNSSIYLLITSISNLITVIYALLVRILDDGFAYEITPSNEYFLCRIRYFVIQLTILTSLICTCMATFDRYLITSRNVRLRQMSTSSRTTIQIIIFIIIVTGLHSIPSGIYHIRSSTGNCILITNIYLYYYLYFVILFLYGIIPSCFLLIFGFLSYKQLQTIQRTAKMNVERQLSRMILLQCIAIICSSIPYCIQEIYISLHSDFDIEDSIAFLFRTIAVILFYSNSVINFYIFLISTPNFRLEVKRIFRLKTTNNRVHAIDDTFS